MITSKAEALRYATSLVSEPIPWSPGQWIVYGPASLREPEGDRTWQYSNTLAEALSARAAWIAQVAAVAIGAGLSAAELERIESEPGRARDRLTRALTEHARRGL